MNMLIGHIGKALGHAICHFETSTDIENFALPSDQIVPLGLITNELLTNIYKHAGQGKDEVHIDITLYKEGDICRLCIADNGRCWDITQVRAEKNGLGLFLVDTLAEQLSGHWECRSTNALTERILTFPIKRTKDYDNKNFAGRRRSYRGERAASLS